MKTCRFSPLSLALALAGSLAALPAAADEPVEVAGLAAFAGLLPLDPGALDGERGGAEVLVLNDSTTRGAVHDNQANFARTGSNWIGEGSLAGAAGLPVVIQNSGNNVLIQNSTIVNLQVQ